LLTKGVRLGWLVHPGRSRVLIFLPGEPVRIATTGETLDANPVLPGFQLAVNDLFGWLTFA
jgi:Uma2 family endonuclease